MKLVEMNMRRAAVSLLLVMCIVGTTFAEGEEAVADEAAGIGVDVTLDFYSKYVWRGQLLNDDYAFQPGVSMTLISSLLESGAAST